MMLGDEDRPTMFEGNMHHMGTTRMHPDPTLGVVDAEARVHGVENLYIAGSSIFPTVGCSNPTLTIVALSLRLTAHLTKADGHRERARGEVSTLSAESQLRSPLPQGVVVADRSQDHAAHPPGDLLHRVGV